MIGTFCTVLFRASGTRRPPIRALAKPFSLRRRGREQVFGEGRGCHPWLLVWVAHRFPVRIRKGQPGKWLPRKKKKKKKWRQRWRRCERCTGTIARSSIRILPISTFASSLGPPTSLPSRLPPPLLPQNPSQFRSSFCQLVAYSKSHLRNFSSFVIVCGSCYWPASESAGILHLYRMIYCYIFVMQVVLIYSFFFFFFELRWW